MRCVFANPTIKWTPAALVVPSPGPTGWRFTGALRPGKLYKKRYQLPIAMLEHELTNISASKFYTKLDYISSYWNLLLHPYSQETQSFTIRDDVFSPAKDTHGTTNVVSHLQ